MVDIRRCQPVKCKNVPQDIEQYYLDLQADARKVIDFVFNFVDCGYVLHQDGDKTKPYQTIPNNYPRGMPTETKPVPARGKARMYLAGREGGVLPSFVREIARHIDPDSKQGTETWQNTTKSTTISTSVAAS